MGLLVSLLVSLTLSIMSRRDKVRPGQPIQQLRGCVHASLTPYRAVSLMTTPTPKPAKIQSFTPTSFFTEESIAESAQILERAFFQLYVTGDIVSLSLCCPVLQASATTVVSISSYLASYRCSVLQASATTLCDEHFSSTAFHKGLNTPGDCAVSQLSQRILDDPPPQVEPSFGEGQLDTQVHKSTIIIYHLQQKMEAHNKYIQFLADVGLLGRLTCVTHHGEVVSTNRLLCEHGELLEAAKTLRKIHDG